MIEEKLIQIAENEPKVYEAGKAEGIEQGVEQGLAEVSHLNDELEQILYGTDTGGKSFYDEFWDSYQINGTRKTYQYGFAGNSWNDTTFKPKYDLILSAGYSGTNMFWGNQTSNMKDVFERQNIKLDTSKCGYMPSAFQQTLTKELPTISLENCKSSSSTPYLFTSSYIETIEKLVFSASTVIASSMFNGATGLKNLVVDGVIADNINLQWSTLLTKASIESIISHLSDTTSKLTVTLSETAVNNAFTTDAWNKLIDTKKNWTISLV